MKIKEVENRVGMSRANIRYYEQEGLLKPTIRNENNYREYSEEDVEQLQKIKILRLLGVSPTDIKLLNGNAISMEELMQKRLRELEKEAKEIQDIHRICETIIEKKIDAHSLNETILTGDQDVWLVRFEELLNKDIVEEIIVKKQLNATMAGMLAWGYLICTAVTTILFTIGNDSKMVEALFSVKRNSGPFVGGRYDINWVLWGIGIAIVIALFSIYYSANVVTHLISFHISAFLLSPLLIGSINRMSGVKVSGFAFTVLWLMLVVYIVVMYILSLKWDKLFTKVKYTLGVAAIYTLVCAIIIMFACDAGPLMVIILAYFTFIIGAKWTIAVSDRKTYNRYYAVRQAGSIVNIIGLNVWPVGYDNKS